MSSLSLGRLIDLGRTLPAATIDNARFWSFRLWKRAPERRGERAENATTASWQAPWKVNFHPAAHCPKIVAFSPRFVFLSFLLYVVNASKVPQLLWSCSTTVMRTLVDPLDHDELASFDPGCAFGSRRKTDGALPGCLTRN